MRPLRDGPDHQLVCHTMSREYALTDRDLAVAMPPNACGPQPAPERVAYVNLAPEKLLWRRRRVFRVTVTLPPQIVLLAPTAGVNSVATVFHGTL